MAISIGEKLFHASNGFDGLVLLGTSTGLVGALHLEADSLVSRSRRRGSSSFFKRLAFVS